MAEQVERLQKLAVDLLDLSRLDAGSIDLNAERVDLAELAGAVTAEFRPFVDGHRTELEVRLPDEPVRALCDRERPYRTSSTLTPSRLKRPWRCAIVNGQCRSCVSCSTMRSGTRRRAPPSQ